MSSSWLLPCDPRYEKGTLWTRSVNAAHIQTIAEAVFFFLSPLRRSQSSSLFGLPCARPGAASCVFSAIFVLRFARSVKRAATG